MEAKSTFQLQMIRRNQFSNFSRLFIIRIDTKNFFRSFWRFPALLEKASKKKLLQTRNYKAEKWEMERKKKLPAFAPANFST